MGYVDYGRNYKSVHDGTMKRRRTPEPNTYKRVTTHYSEFGKTLNHTIRHDRNTVRTLIVYAQYPNEDALPVGALLCYNGACRYADVMSSGKLGNFREVPPRYTKRFPHDAMVELCGCDGARVYARKV